MQRTTPRILTLLLAGTALAAPMHRVFILSGQSNMNGLGRMEDLMKKLYTPPKRVKLFKDQEGCPEGSAWCLPDDHTWRPLRVQASDETFGPEMGLSEILSAKYKDDTVDLLKVSWGGSSLETLPSWGSLIWGFDSDLQGWSSAGTASPLTWNAGGTVGATINGVDPILLSPPLALEISPEKNNIIRVKMRNRSSSTLGRIYFCPVGGSWSEENAKTFEVTSDDPVSREYVIDMSTVKNWKGTLAQFRIDPSIASIGSYQVDEVRIGTGMENRRWDFALPAGMSGWMANSSVSNFQQFPVANGTALDRQMWGQVTASDPWVLSPEGLSVNIDSSKTLRIRLWNATADNQAQIYFATDASPSLDEAKSVIFPVNASDIGFNEYIVDMSGNPHWKGTLRQLRIDPTRYKAEGSFAIDNIRLTGWASHSWSNPGYDLYPWFLRNVRKALADLANKGVAYKLEGMFWMQGEADARDPATASVYDRSLSRFVSKVRADLNSPNLPFLYGMIHSASLTAEQSQVWYQVNGWQAGAYSNTVWPYYKDVHQGQYRAQFAIANTRCVEGPGREETQVGGCSFSNPTPTKQNCDPGHYGTDAILNVGRHFGNAWNDFTNRVSSPGCQNPANWD
ncbi:MAG TPA: sialate O-acetylesterase [Fibrobacteria bacterium]|nr:sialate O-acetylesterase [Fibrobacteria bacterium]